jgi:nucleoside-diphosphate-sugar epimerase
MLEDGWQVTATDLATAANRKAVSRRRSIPRFAARWADLTHEADVTALLDETRPDVIVHLAAVIPPTCYAVPTVARAVNVDSVRNLVVAAEQATKRPRFVLASSMAVYGARNPHRDLGLLTADTPVDPADSYGQHKAEAEVIVRDADLDFVILRLAGVLTVEPRAAGGSEVLQFGALLPTDGRLQTVDVRDVAAAFAAAAREPVVGETFLIGGDESHRRVQGDVGAEVVAAMGLYGAMPLGRPGNPDDDAAWFATDWMDTTDAQAKLRFQHYSWSDVLTEIRARTGWKRYPLRLVAPFMHAALRRRSPYRDAPGSYADLWGGVRAAWGDPAPDAG